MVNLKDLNKILDLFKESGIAELEIEEKGVRVKLRKDSPVPSGGATHLHYPAPTPSFMPMSFGNMPLMPASYAPQMAQFPIVGQPPAGQQVDPSSVKHVTAPHEPAGDSALEKIESPMVGTFYRAPSQGAEPFVKKGDSIKKGQVLCIIEAMKLMNELESDIAGEIVDILVENGDSVEYGQPLFLIRPSK